MFIRAWLLNPFAPFYDTPQEGAAGGEGAPAAPAAAETPAAAPAGTTVLSDGAGATPAEVGQSAEVEAARAAGKEMTAEQAREAVTNGPPEHIPEKFWDHEKGEVRTEDLAKSYSNLEKLMSSEKVPIPTNADDVEGWERWHTANGRPEAPDGYEVELPTMPEGMEYDTAAEGRLREYAFQNGWNQNQFNNIYDGEIKNRLESAAAYQAAQEQARTEMTQSLQRQHGDKYDAEMAATKGAIQKYGDADFFQFLEDTGLGNDPRMFATFNRISKDLGGETKLAGTPQAQEMQVADHTAAIAKFRETNSKVLMNSDHPDHGRIVKELSSMYDDKNGKVLIT